MPDYQNGKIYQIWSPNTDKVYIGSTTQPLHKRLYEHTKGLTGKKYVYSRKVLECGDARIELIEEYPCAKKSELDRREGQVMRGYDNRVNKCIAGRTGAEYRADNREVLAAKAMEYKKKPEVKEHIAARMKVYHQREDVKARRNTQNQEYYLRKREHVLAKRKEYQQRPEVKERKAAQDRERYLRKKEHVLAQQKEWEQRPEVRERRNAQARERRQRKKEQQPIASA